MKYISKYLELKIVQKPTYSKEIDGRIVVTPGESIQFHDGMFETENPEDIKFPVIQDYLKEREEVERIATFDKEGNLVAVKDTSP